MGDGNDHEEHIHVQTPGIAGITHGPGAIDSNFVMPGLRRDPVSGDGFPEGWDLATSDDIAAEQRRERDAAYTFLRQMGLDPTPDAVGQLIEAFLPCLRIMCERGYDRNGANWREGGWRSQLVDSRKKFMRLWFHAWVQGRLIKDHPVDMINYLGFFIRIIGQEDPGSPWGEWGEPGGEV